jgi:hypothetical protein
MKLNNIEREVIFLRAIKELIDEMVNWEVVELVGKDPHSNTSFNSITHRRFFNILLVDFLSCSDKKVLGIQLSYLSALKEICHSPNFNIDNSISSLTKITNEFIDWLEKEVTVEKVWFPSIDLEINLSIKRIEFIKICGNISKHNFTRLSGVVKELKEIFKRNNIVLEDEDALLIIDEFYEWFHDDIFSYHSSAIAEFLNNIRWGIYEYLQPEFHRSIVIENNEHPLRYHYTYSHGINNRFAKTCYRGLMNDIRSKPYMKKFQVTEYLKMRY